VPITAPGAPPAHSSYEPAYFSPLFAIEDRHFWFRARNRVISQLVASLTRRLPPGYHVLEVGCGTGNVLRVLEQACPRGTVIGMDLFAQGLSFARRRTACPLVQGDVHAAPFRVPFEVIGLFDVLEHLSDDQRILADLWTLLAPGGTLLLTVPAHAVLWSYFDEAAHHCRRYAPAELHQKLRAAGYEVEYLTQYMAPLFPLVWLGRRLARLVPHRDRAARTADALALSELRITPGLNGLLSWLLAREAPLIARRRQLPIGTSLLAVARKPRTSLQRNQNLLSATCYGSSS
jgi:SAM-dependent methyltransferase